MSVENDQIPVITRTQVYLTDPEFFCNKSWTISYNMNTNSWISFHSYIPNWYMGENNFFYSGINGCCDDFDSSFSAFVGNTNKPTTSTTTTNPTRPNYTTTTRYVPSCDLEGTLTELFCELDGEVEITVPATTTTTVCSRPSGLRRISLYGGYQIDANPPVISTGSFEDACSAIAVLAAAQSTSVAPITFTAAAQSYTIGQVVYYDFYSNDCTFVPDGWYFSQQGLFESYTYYIENGILMEIVSCECGTTTTTTTIAPIIEECCGVLYISGDSVIITSSFETSLTLTTLTLPGFTTSSGIAMTSTSLWAINTQITQWDITLNPFTATYNTDIAFPGGFTTSSGIAALNNSTLIAVDSSTSPQEVVELDITTPIATLTSMFPLQANRIATSNPLYTTSDKFIIVNQDNVSLDYYISQYEYSTGTLELDINIGAVEGVSLHECDCSVYVTDSLGQSYIIGKIAPYDIIETLSLDVPITSATQVRTCVTSSITQNGNITSTTSTTSTTTTIP